MSVAIQDLYLEHVWVLYPGNQEYPLDGKISVIPAASLPILTEKFGKEPRDAKINRNVN
jgi:hypothetical protein